ncbi:MAG: hypothetical protein MJ213_05625 [Bacilli bacterium]|nr:hypothetical protein [Bacilli bacterium]
MKKTYPIIEYIRPVKIVESNRCEKSSVFLKKRPLVHSFETTNCARLKSKGFIILDFGKEYSGGLRILTHFHTNPINNITLRIRLGESLGEIYQEIGEKGTSNDHSPRDFNVNVPALSDLTFAQSGFRFARVDNVSEFDVSLRAILLSYQHVNLKIKGYFRSDDALVNKIFDTSLRTAYMCIQNGYLVEAIKRDRLVWSGDLNVQLKTTLDTMGCFDAITNTLDALKKVNHLPGWMNNIPSYSLWYILNVYEVNKFLGNANFIKKYLGFIKGIIEQINSCINEYGEIVFNKIDPEHVTDMMNFIDWTSVNDKNCNVALTSFTIYVLTKAKELFVDNKFIDEIIKKIKVNDITDDANKGVRALFEIGKHHKPETLLNNGVKTTSTFLSYMIYHVMVNNGYANEALDKMKEYYGKMLDLNASTFFEAFDEAWTGGKIDEYRLDEKYFHADYGEHCYKGYRLSLCHAWSSGPVPFLLEDVAGITLVNSNTYIINPKPGNLKHIEAGLMSKKGLIEVIVDNDNGNIKYSVKSPKGINIIKK